MTADRKTAQKKCSGPLGHPWFSGLSDRESPVCAQWSRQQPLSGFRPEVEHVSTTRVVTATTRVVGRVRFNGYGRWWAVLSGESRIPNESSSFLRFSRFFDPGVTGSKHMGDTSTRLVRFPTLIVPEQAGHSVASVVTATNPLSCSLGPTVTCRDGTCVHLPGYCQDWTFGEQITNPRHRFVWSNCQSCCGAFLRIGVVPNRRLRGTDRKDGGR
jgi:hypothetical protein